MATVSTTTDKVICHCLRVTTSQLQDAVEFRQCATIKDVMCATEAGTGCTACHRKIIAMLTSNAD